MDKCSVNNENQVPQLVDDLIDFVLIKSVLYNLYRNDTLLWFLTHTIKLTSDHTIKNLFHQLADAHEITVNMVKDIDIPSLINQKKEFFQNSSLEYLVERLNECRTSKLEDEFRGFLRLIE